MAARPSLALIYSVLVLAVISMAAAVYFGGHGEIRLAMFGTMLFVGLGGFAFDLARRRSM